MRYIKTTIIIAILVVAILSGCVGSGDKNTIYSDEPLKGSEARTIDTVYSMRNVNGNTVVKINNDNRQFVLRRLKEAAPVNPDMQQALQYSYDNQKKIEIFYTADNKYLIAQIEGVRYVD